MDKKTNLSFPKRFLWGASTSAHQIEGGLHNQWSVWELDNAKSKANQSSYQYGDLDNWTDIEKDAKNPDNYVSGLCIDHYSRYEEDFDLLQKMNMNAFRFSIEWSRIEPVEGAWSVEAIDHYKQYVASLRRRNIEPVVTLFHFTLPVWFCSIGGFEKRSNVKYFIRFVEKIIQELGSSIKYVITINEPGVYAQESYRYGHWPPNISKTIMYYKVLNNLAYAHNKAYDVIHGLSRRYKVSVADNSGFYYPGDDAFLSRKSAAIIQYLQDDYFLNKVIKKCDFLGLNYYFSSRVYGYRVHNPNKKISDLGWDLNPGDIQYVLERLSEKYNKSILITENGLADAQDRDRQWWITQTLIGIKKAMDHGAKVDGYLHWSLLDNFEWDKGFWPKFGLVNVDRTSQQRTLRPSAVWFSKIIKHLRK